MNRRIEQRHTCQPEALQPSLTVMDLPMRFSAPEGAGALALADSESASAGIFSPRHVGWA